MTTGLVMWGRAPVPYTAPWTGEMDNRKPFVRYEHWRGKRIRMLCEGVNTPGVGKPMFSSLHNDRCREVVKQRLCQICRLRQQGPMYCMNSGELDHFAPLINDGLPMCAEHAALSLQHCPALQQREAAGTLRIYRTMTWDVAPIILGIVPEAKGGHPEVNRLVGEGNARGEMTFGGIKLVLRTYELVTPADVRRLHSIGPG